MEGCNSEILSSKYSHTGESNACFIPRKDSATFFSASNAIVDRNFGSRNLIPLTRD